MTDQTPSVAPATLTISAVIPCFNASAYLQEALASVKNQTRPVHEIIVVDDGSDDGSAELAERCGARVIPHATNRGEGVARNTGWRAATSDAIAWLDADDAWRPNHVEVIGGLLERFPQVACAFSSVQRFGLDDQLVTGLVPPGEPCELLKPAFQSWLHTSLASIIRRSALEEVGGYDEARIAIDFDMWLRLAHHNLFVASPEVTANWRWHEEQQSAAALGQILAVQRYRRRFLKTLKANGEDLLAEELEPLMGPAWKDHVNGVVSMVDQRKRRALESRGEPYPGPTLVDRARWAALTRLPPSVIDLAWHATGGRLEA